MVLGWYSTEMDGDQPRSGCCRKATHTHQAFPSSPQQGERDHTEVLASSDQAGLPESLANAGESSHIGGLVLRGGYCSRLLRLFALRQGSCLLQEFSVLGL